MCNILKRDIKMNYRVYKTACKKIKINFFNWYWFYRQKYFKRQIIVKYTIMIWRWSDLWNILYIIIKTGRMRIMKLYPLTKNISEMTFTKFHEIRTCITKILDLRFRRVFFWPPDRLRLKYLDYIYFIPRSNQVHTYNQRCW